MDNSGKHYGAVLRRIKVTTEQNRLDVIHLMQANQTEIEIRIILDDAVSAMDGTIRAIDKFFETPLGRTWGPNK